MCRRGSIIYIYIYNGGGRAASATAAGLRVPRMYSSPPPAPPFSAAAKESVARARGRRKENRGFFTPGPPPPPLLPPLFIRLRVRRSGIYEFKTAAGFQCAYIYIYIILLARVLFPSPLCSPVSRPLSCPTTRRTHARTHPRFLLLSRFYSYSALFRARVILSHYYYNIYASVDGD